MISATSIATSTATSTASSTASSTATGAATGTAVEPPLLRKHSTVRWAYTHLNNTNPVLYSTSEQHARVRAAGVELPPDGTVLEL